MMTARTTHTSAVCIWCGEATTFENLDCEKLEAWRGGALIQNVWPEMDHTDREVMMNGTHPACYDRIFDNVYPHGDHEHLRFTAGGVEEYTDHELAELSEPFWEDDY